MNSAASTELESDAGLLSHTRAPFAVVATDEDDVPLLWANDAFLDLLGGNSPGQDFSTLLKRCVLPSSFALLRDSLAAISLNGSCWEGELLILDGESRIRILRATVAALSWQTASSGVAALIAVHDLTATKALEKEQRHRLKAECLNTMAGAIIHHYANIFTVVQGNLQLAWHDLPPEVRRHRNEIGVAKSLYEAMRGTERAIGLIGQLHVYVRPEEATREPTDLVSVCEEAVLLHQPNLYSGRVELSGDSISPVNVLVDRKQIVQVVDALLRNALEATGDGRRGVFLRTGSLAKGNLGLGDHLPGDHPNPQCEYAFIEVEDRGPGIPHADIERIFDPFFSTKFLGRGLGLAMVRSIVRSHKGWIAVANKPGQGCTFVIHLPRVTHEPAGGGAKTL